MDSDGRSEHVIDEGGPADLVHRGYAAFATGDVDTLREVLSPDIQWHLPGRSALGGTYRGVDAVLGFFGALMERSGGTFRAELIGCAEVTPGLVAALTRTTGDLPGGALDQLCVNVFRIADGNAVEVIEYKADNYVYDAAVGTAVTLPDARTPAEPIRT